MDFYNQQISGNYHEPTEILGYFHLELLYQSAAEMLKTQEQLRTNIEEVRGSFNIEEVRGSFGGMRLYAATEDKYPLSLEQI